MRNFEFYKSSIDSEYRKKSVQLSKNKLWDVESSGGIMPYSFESLAIAESEILLDKDVSDIDTFIKYIELLPTAQTNNNTEYMTALEDFMYADAKYTALLFQYAAWQHIEKADENSAFRQTLSDTISLIPEMEEVRKNVTENEKELNSYTITKYREQRKTAFDKMENVYGKYEILYKER